MRSPVVTLAWDIWLRNRTLIQVAVAIVVFSCLLNAVVPELGGKTVAEMLNFHLAVAALLLVLSIFGYTEFNPQKGTTGFPNRLFVLPVTTVKLVAVPVVLGVAALELLIVAWTVFVLPPTERSIWIAIQLGVYMVMYQTILWTLGSLKSLRLLVVGLTGVVMISLRIFPSIRRLPDTTAMGLLAGVAVASFLISWIYVARERSGARLRLISVNSIVATASDRMPARQGKAFRSPHAAQFWFEWRRSGHVLPTLVCALLVLVIGPLSWYLRDDGSGSFRVLVAVILMPPMLALPIGKAFSKADFWSKELSLSAFIAVRPLSTVDIVAVKLRVAAASTAISWLIVFTFLSLWLPLWAKLDSLVTLRGTLWMMYGHRLYPQYAIAALLIIASILLTWRFLVGGMWLGLSGNTRVFAFSAFPYVVVPLLVVPGLLIFDEPIQSWLLENTRQWLPVAVWIAAAGLVIKLWLAAFSWRAVPLKYLRQYLPLWLVGSACLIALAFLTGDVLALVLPEDTYRVRNLLTLIGLQIIPLARLGLAPSFLDKNRHR